jgi:hypothetical protein
MKTLKNIIDTWNMIEKYNIVGYEEVNGAVISIPESEYDRLLDSAKNKTYIKNLVK